jgi:phospholipid/cholesterol/gamma-HCH transport system substrate-binding protein
MNSRRRDDRIHEIKVGLTVLIGLSILIFAVLWVGQSQGVLQPRYKLHCMMSRVNGLQTGAPVRLAGVRVGSVVKVEFSESVKDQKIEVVLEINKNVQERIRTDSEAHIGTMGLLGDKYVGVSMGSLEYNILQDGDLLASTDPIDVEQLLDEGVSVFNSFRGTTDNLIDITDDIKEGRGTLGLLINDPRMYYDIDRILLLLERVVMKVESGTGSFSKMFSDPELYNNINNLLKSTEQLADSLVEGQGSAGQFIRNPDLFDELKMTLQRVNRLTERIETGEGSLGRAMTDEQLYKDLLHVTGKLDSLVQDIRRNPQRYLKVEIF